MSGGATAHILRLAAFLRAQGVNVHFHATVLPVSGLYRSETGEVFINEPSAPAALMTLAHEAGHWVGSWRRPKAHEYQRERQAFVYGWWLMVFLGIPVARTDWIARERSRRAAPPAPPTEHLYRKGEA